MSAGKFAGEAGVSAGSFCEKSGFSLGVGSSAAAAGSFCEKSGFCLGVGSSAAAATDTIAATDAADSAGLLSSEQIARHFAPLAPKLPEHIAFCGDLTLLDAPIISIVGSREMSLYTKNAIGRIASGLAGMGAVVASGGALGVDIAAAQSAWPRTIAVLPSGLQKPYPQANAPFLERIKSAALALSEYPPHHVPRRHDFLHRNRLVVALGRALILAQASPASGTLNSAGWAAKMRIPVYALAQQAGASDGSMALVASGAAKLIYDIDEFLEQMRGALGLNGAAAARDELLDFIGCGCSLDDALARFGEAVYDYELDGKITIDGALVRAL